MRITLKVGDLELNVYDDSETNVKREHGNEGADKPVGQSPDAGNDKPKVTAGFTLPIE